MLILNNLKFLLILIFTFLQVPELYIRQIQVSSLQAVNHQQSFLIVADQDKLLVFNII